MTPSHQDGVPAPTVLRIRLGAQLRRLRQQRNLTREAAGWEIRSSESKISRMELGRVPFKERDVADLLTLYGVGEHERVALLSLARQANAPGWWQQYGDVVPPWFGNYLGLEQAAALIRTYDLQFVPDLLQTAGYARAVLRLTHTGASEAEIGRRVELCQGRQQVLRSPDPPLFWAVLDEAVLHRQIGGPEVMRAQLEALIDAAERPNIRLQIVSFRAGRYAAAGFPFAILRFAEPELPDLVYVEQLTSALYLDKPGDVEHYAVTIERACLDAGPFDHTTTVLREVLNEITA
jgi:transcriptional regulator with XRE-family HTH domain